MFKDFWLHLIIFLMDIIHFKLFHHIKEYNNNVNLISDYSSKKKPFKEDFSSLEIFDIGKLFR